MPWVRFDDQYPIHRKVDGLSDAAFRLHTSAIFWSARNLTDGFVSREDLDGVSARVRTPERFAAECTKRGVWHLAGEGCSSESCPAPVNGDGWVIHDYWEFQPTKSQVLQKREENRERQHDYRERHRNGSRNAVTNAVTKSPPSRPVISVVDVGDQSPERNARGDPVIDEIIKAIYATTSRVIDPSWAAKIAGHILSNHDAANPAAYVRKVIENDPDPHRRFLEHLWTTRNSRPSPPAAGAATRRRPARFERNDHAMTTRAEHLDWCKQRALEYADQGDTANAIASLRSDLGKHPETAQSARIVDELMMPLAMIGDFKRPGELRKFIEGFN